MANSWASIAGAFTAFCFELTPHLRFGQTNELRVRVDNRNQADVPPLSGDFNMDGGLYRPVQLIVTDAVCVTPLDFASPGVYETLQSLDDQHASVEIKSLISNGGDGRAIAAGGDSDQGCGRGGGRPTDATRHPGGGPDRADHLGVWRSPSRISGTGGRIPIFIPSPSGSIGATTWWTRWSSRWGCARWRSPRSRDFC